MLAAYTKKESLSSRLQLQLFDIIS